MIAYTIQLFPFENVHDAISIDIIEKLVLMEKFELNYFNYLNRMK